MELKCPRFTPNSYHYLMEIFLGLESGPENKPYPVKIQVTNPDPRAAVLYASGATPFSVFMKLIPGSAEKPEIIRYVKSAIPEGYPDQYVYNSEIVFPPPKSDEDMEEPVSPGPYPH
jgi:hypothetical protein